MKHNKDTRFTTDLTDTLSDLPAEFREYVSRIAWERGHSCGHDEVRAIAEEMVADLLPVVKAYDERKYTSRPL